MWNNTLDSDVVKEIVSFGTELIKIIDELGLVKTALIGLAIGGSIKSKGPIKFLGDIVQFAIDASDKMKEFGSTMKATFSGDFSKISKPISDLVKAQQAAQASTLATKINTQDLTSAQIVNQIATKGLSGEVAMLNVAQVSNAMQTSNVTREQRLAVIQSLGLSTATKALSRDQLITALTTNGVAKAEAANIAAAVGLTGANTGLAASFMALWTAMWPVLVVMLAIGAVVGIVAIFDSLIKTTAELSEELSNLKSELSDLESEIDDINSELETTQERMAELIAMPSLSFVEQEELANLRAQTAELERQLELKNNLAKSKESDVIDSAEEHIDRVWDGKRFDKAYYVDDRGAIRDDEKAGGGGWWKIGVSAKEALDKSMNSYKAFKQRYDEDVDILTHWDDDDQSKNEELFKKHGMAYVQKHVVEKRIEGYKKDMDEIISGIDMVFADESFDDLKYGMSNEIDVFLDELYAYNLKWQQAQGHYVKSSAITSAFDASSTAQLQEFGKELTKIANSDLTDTEKNAEILKQLDSIDGVIGDGINKVDGKTDAYNRLFLAMDTVGVTAQEIVDYFVLETGSFNSNTIEGIANQYAHMESVMNALKNMSGGKFTFDGVEYNWEEFFTKDDQGKFEAKALKFSEILVGMDKDARETFIGIVESAANSAGDLSQIDWDQAMSKLNLSGIDRTFELLNNEFEGLNNEIFADAAEDINGFIDTVSELQSALESVAGSMDLVRAAQEQMNGSGRISVKTALELMQTTKDWDKVLEISEGTIKLKDGAEQHLINTQLNAIKTQLEYIWTTAKARYETALAAQGELDYADNSGIVMTAESIKAEAIGRVSAVVVSLGAAMDKLVAGEWGSVFSTFKSTYASATETVVQDSQRLTTNLADLKKDAEEKKKMFDAFSSVDSFDEFMNNYDFDTDPGDKYGDSVNDAFQKEMDYWENRIGANQAKYTQLQNEIDLLEAKGQKADASFYEEQIELENERKWLLEQQKAAALAHLATLKEGSEEWWEVANTLNDIEGELDDVTASIVDLQDAIGEIDTYKFEEFNNRLDDITSKLGTIRDLIATEGEEDWFDDQGEWTESGVAVLGTYIQELETYKQGLAAAEDAYANYVKEYTGNEKEYAKIGIHSEQELYDKRQELIEQQYDYAQSISNTEQSIVDMYESNIDAIEEYTDTLVDSYNDYIDSVKEALDAERDLYDFKKNVQKQSKDIAAIERRIASLSGSTNAADVAERRKLEAELYESRESLNDTYYDHARSAQDEALDAEATSYEETMTKFVEGLRTSLETATMNMDEFLMGVTSMVMYNADTVLAKYQETNLPLTDELTNPWIAAKDAVRAYSGDALDLMNKWTEDGGFFTQFNETGTKNLQSPWTAGSTAAGAFETSVGAVMDNVVTKIEDNVKTASGKLSDLYQQIITTENRASEITVDSDTPIGNQADGNMYVADGKPRDLRGNAIDTDIERLQAILNKFFGARLQVDGSYNRDTTDAVKYMQKVIGDTQDGLYTAETKKKLEQYLNNINVGSWFRETGVYIPGALKTRTKGSGNPARYSMYAKGTLGTTRDEFAITDESWIGEEITLAAGKNGQLQYLKKGSAVMPADISANLVEWGKINPSILNAGVAPNVNMISNAVNKPEFNFAFDALVKAENITEETLPAVKKLVTQELNRFTRELNYALKGKGAR